MYCTLRYALVCFPNWVRRRSYICMRGGKGSFRDEIEINRDNCATDSVACAETNQMPLIYRYGHSREWYTQTKPLDIIHNNMLRLKFVFRTIRNNDTYYAYIYIYIYSSRSKQRRTTDFNTITGCIKEKNLARREIQFD